MSPRTPTVVIPPVATPPGRRALAVGWCGEEWIDALETPGPYGDPSGHESRLARARTYARKGAVGEITVRPGTLSARVQGSRLTPYRCEISVPEFADSAWNRLVDTWTADPEVCGDLASGTLTEAASAAADALGLSLTPHELTYHCSCPDWGDPCKHAAALAYRFAQALDTRPQALLLLRGRDAESLAETLVDRAVGLGGEESAALAGIPASEVFARARTGVQQPPLPALPPLPGQPGPPADWDVPSGPTEDVDGDALRLLVTDAARRAAAAYTQATGGDLDETAGDGGLCLDGDPWHDTVRWAARTQGAEDVVHVHARLLNSSDQARAHLARSAVAWRFGGPAALDTLDGTCLPPSDDEAAARAALARLRLPGRTEAPRLRRTGGRLRLTGWDVEVRRGPDGRWYPYRRERGQWWPAGVPAADAAAALRGVLSER